MPPDDVLEDVADVGSLVERGGNGADGVGPDRVATLDELDELVDDRPRLGHALAVAVERELVAAERDRATEPVAQRVEHAVGDAGELGRNFIGNDDHVLHAASVGVVATVTVWPS